ncbi:hypothetical protein G7068_16005 [Leucobacter viscericola]|uniref:Uncharacterized protein n=1 Tax=Leucobacter viscericola TaxID=2714935 RepID=A0A6G7XIX5_9MICO|nr:hypothetical protein [Leucobacter viscericola]QIK61775.1 hypothetical protein G7068_00040 [Leucobacter viscericola]QIK64550.1 hypothetical protein G7068_16005 [Leucobacter viscericola]
MLYLRVNNHWRRALYTIDHPSGDRYALLPVYGQPDTVLKSVMEQQPWLRDIRTPEPKLAS